MLVCNERSFQLHGGSQQVVLWGPQLCDECKPDWNLEGNQFLQLALILACLGDSGEDFCILTEHLKVVAKFELSAQSEDGHLLWADQCHWICATGLSIHHRHVNELTQFESSLNF